MTTSMHKNLLSS